MVKYTLPESPIYKRLTPNPNIAPIFRTKRMYKYVTDVDRGRLIMMVRQGFSIKQASYHLKINYSAAKYIIKNSQSGIDSVILPKISTLPMITQPADPDQVELTQVEKHLLDLSSSRSFLEKALETLNAPEPEPEQPQEPVELE